MFCLVLIFLRIRIQNPQLCPIIPRLLHAFILTSRYQCGLLIIINPAQCLCHDLIKPEIHSLQNLSSASKVLPQLDLLCHSLCRQIIRIGLILSLKQLRACHPELIDALLYIAYHEQVRIVAFLFSGNAGEDRLLKIIGILILINQNLCISIP